jgi:thiamine-monophosphate kinase
VDEFELISRYFDRRQKADGVRVGIGDDGAVLKPSGDLDQVQVIDTLVSGVHFPVDTDPADIAYRAVAVNLSDVAAMGARPRWMTLALTIDEFNEQWLESFATGLFEAADTHDVALVGGDTTRGPTITVTVTVIADVESECALLRSGAEPGDSVFVTGTLGDAAAGLNLLQRGEKDGHLVARFLRPTPRISTGQALIRQASAAIDVSDGLAGDLAKLLKASGVGADVDIEKLPLSDALCSRFNTEDQQCFALTGGDDYELCFTAKASSVADIPGITEIGKVVDLSRLEFSLKGAVVEVSDSGYRHFQ